MRFAYLIEAEYAPGPGFEPARRHLLGDFLEGNVGQW
jgi:hypothetical protein